MNKKTILVIDDEEDENLDFDLDEEFEEFKSETSLVQYNKYKDEKLEKIKEFIDNMEAEKEQVSTSSSRIDQHSFEMGKQAGNNIQLEVQKKLKKTKE